MGTSLYKKGFIAFVASDGHKMKRFTSEGFTED
jgi:hypothetical protein